MMVLLDTHILLWAMLDDPRLPLSARTYLQDPRHQVWVSTVSYCEIAIKASLGRSGLSCSASEVASYVDRCGLPQLDLRPAHALMLETLPWHHRDPFDRMLVAQALAEPMRLITHDPLVARYSPTIIQV